MDDINAKLTELLSQPDAAEKLSQAAAALLGGAAAPETGGAGTVGDIFGDVDIGSIMHILSALRQDTGDPRAGLLLALRPHLSKDRQQRVDTAVKLLKLAKILPLLQEQGLFKL